MKQVRIRVDFVIPDAAASDLNQALELAEKYMREHSSISHSDFLVVEPEEGFEYFEIFAQMSVG